MNEIERLESDLLRTFVTVAETGNVTRAAGRLYRTQSAISVQVRRLEERLGTRLFERGARGVALTAAGETLLAEARPILVRLDRLAARFREPLGGRVRVGIPEEYGSGVLERILGDFAQRHPGVEVAVQCGFSVGFPETLAAGPGEPGSLDLAVYTARPGESFAGLGPEILLRESLVWAASPAWRDGGIRDRSEPVPLALFDRACWWREAATASLEGAGRTYRIAYSSESVAGVKAAIAAGLAVGLLARSTVSPLVALGAEVGLPALPTADLVLLHREGEATPERDSAVAAMAEAIRRGFAGLAPGGR